MSMEKPTPTSEQISKESYKYTYKDNSQGGLVVFECMAEDILEADRLYQEKIGSNPEEQSHIGCSIGRVEPKTRVSAPQEERTKREKTSESSERSYEVITPERARVPIKMWTRGVIVEPVAIDQLSRIARLPFIFRHIAVMPDVHMGKGATVGSVIATERAVIPAAVGVDIGCGMMAVCTSLTASQLPDNLHLIRSAIEAAVPHGRTANGGPADKGAWRGETLPPRVIAAWSKLEELFRRIVGKHPKIGQSNNANHLGTLGTGNHFIELSLDEEDRVWIVLHSGSRGVGGRIGSYFIDLAKKAMQRWFIELSDADLAYLVEGTGEYADYMEAVMWAQNYARENREIMMEHIIEAIQSTGLLPPFASDLTRVNCHHNYVARERHFGRDVLVTRKGAIRAREGDMGIIPGSMGARSFIVTGRGNRDSFTSSSHGAGRAMSRTEALRRFTVQDHEAATQGIECRKDADVVDETPGAYKPIDAVMAAQADLVEAVHELHQVVCVKG